VTVENMCSNDLLLRICVEMTFENMYRNFENTYLDC